MRVRRDFGQIYAAEPDPWAIGDADSERYDLYHRMVVERSEQRTTILDIGCGLGAFLARFQGDFDELIGVEVSEIAVDKGRRRFPFIRYVTGSAEDLDSTLPDDRDYDTIVYSDVIYYLNEAGKRRSLRWIAEHLAPGGLAFIAGWAPGGKYLDRSEFRRLVGSLFVIEDERFLESEHAVFVCRPRRRLVALTVDYETWQPIPPGKSIDWERDVFDPAERLLAVCDEQGAKLTIMAEMGEYLWLRENDPTVAERMERQWREAAERGHDVQMHLHPNWLPELGARRDGDRWTWDMSLARAHDYPGELDTLIRRCVDALRSSIRPVRPDYEVTSYRAGAYEAQPFERIYDALQANGILSDTSVLAGDRRPDRGYDFGRAFSTHQPYFAARFDPQLKAPPAERAVVELPVFATSPGEKWTFDNEEGARFAERLVRHCDRAQRLTSSESYRRARRVRSLLNHGYARLRRWRRSLNRALPRRLAHYMMDYPPERLVGHDYFVLLGHTKTELDLPAIAAELRRLAADGRFEFVTLAEMVREAKAELSRTTSRDRAGEATRQVEREYAAVLSDDRNLAQSDVLQRMIPLDRRAVLDVGCGDGAWSARIAELFPWLSVVGVDVGEDFISKARSAHASPRVSFQLADFAELPFDEGSFDCVYADNSLEHAFDVQATLAELHRVLADGGVLVAAIPPDAVNPSRICDNHTWKTEPGDVRRRLKSVGFADVSIDEIDIFRKLGMSPYPPSQDRLLYVRAWKRERPATAPERAVELTSTVHRALDPSRPQASDTDPIAILADGHAWCWGYCLVLGEALRREGFEIRWVTMVAEGHPRGAGPRATDSHEVVELRVGDDHWTTLDPMANVVFDAPVAELVRDPGLADVPRTRDERYVTRGYDLYSTAAWYSLVKRVAVRERLSQRLRFVPASRFGSAGKR
jgi:SAM-dependent methyltransferase